MIKTTSRTNVFRAFIVRVTAEEGDFFLDLGADNEPVFCLLPENAWPFRSLEVCQNDPAVKRVIKNNKGEILEFERVEVIDITLTPIIPA